MVFSRRAFLRFAGVGATTSVLPRVVRQWQEQRGMASTMAQPSAIHTYESGVDNAAVTGHGVIRVNGAPVYSAADAVHGQMGWVAPASSGGGQLVYANPNVNASSGSVYLTVHSLDGATATVVGLKQGVVAGSFLVRVRLRSDGRVDVVDGGGLRLAISQPGWTTGQKMRLDWQQSWDGTNVTLTVWLYVDNPEGWRPDLVLRAYLRSGSAAYISLAGLNASATLGFDTYREYHTATMPAPYRPVIGARVVHSYDAGTDGGVVVAGMPGAHGVTRVTGRPMYSTTAALHGVLGVSLPATTKGGTLWYDNPYPPAHTGSLYVQTTARARNDCRIVTFHSGTTVFAQIKLSPRGTVVIADSAGGALAETSTRAPLGRWTRLDWKGSWDGSNLTVVARCFSTAAESIDKYAQISARVLADATPDTLAIGSRAAGWQVNLDTFRTYGDTIAWPMPFDTSRNVVVEFTLTGGAASHGILVNSTLSAADAGASVDLAVSTSADLSTPIRVGPQTADSDSIVRHLVTGMDANTTYYAGLLDRGVQVGETVRFKTLPPNTGSWSRDIAVVSCQCNSVDPISTELVWSDILAWDADDVWHLGDWGYWGQEIAPTDPYTADLFHYTRSLQRMPMMRRAMQAASLNVVTISDHELTINGDPTTGMFNSPESIRELVAFQKLMPVRTYGDTRNPRRGRYYSYDLGGAVRVIVTDFRTPDRSNADDPDGPSKKMFGARQLSWLLETLDSTKVNLLVNETSWLADPNANQNRADDKPWSYYTEQRTIANYITNGGYKVAWIGGDRHYVGYLAGSGTPSNTLGGFPCYISSGICKYSLDLQVGELMTWQFGANNTNPKRPVCGYMRLTVAYDGATGAVTLSGVGRAVLDTTTDVSTWTMRDIPGGTASDRWRVQSPALVQMAVVGTPSQAS